MRSIPLTRRWGGVLGSRLASSGQKSGVPNRGPVTWGSALLTAALGGGLLMYYQSEKERRQTTTTTTVKAVGKAALGGLAAPFRALPGFMDEPKTLAMA